MKLVLALSNIKKKYQVLRSKFSNHREGFNFPYWIAEPGQRITMLITGPACRFFLHMKVVGKENLKGIKPGVVFAMNHLSEWDPVMLPNTFSMFSKMVPIYIISRESNFYRENKNFRSMFYGGNFFRFMGAFPVIVGVKNYEDSLSFQIQMLKKGKNVLIFPEGRISRDGSLQPAKGGVIALVKATGCQIVPVAVSGHYRASMKELLGRRRTAMVHFGKPISSEEIFAEYPNAQPCDYVKIAEERIMGKIAELLPLLK